MRTAIWRESRKKLARQPPRTNSQRSANIGKELSVYSGAPGLRVRLLLRQTDFLRRKAEEGLRVDADKLPARQISGLLKGRLDAGGRLQRRLGGWKLVPKRPSAEKFPSWKQPEP